MSNRLYLTVYERDDLNGSSVGTVDEATELEYRHVLHGTGRGRVKIARSHPQADLLVQDRFVRVHSDAGIMGGFFLDEASVDLSADEGEGDEWLEWIGRGQIAILESGVMDNDSNIAGGHDPIDGYWDTDSQGPAAGASNGHPIPMYKRVLAEMLLNTPSGISIVDHSSFTYTLDSNGSAVPFISGEFQGANVGDDGLTLLARMSQLGGVVFQMSHDFELSAYLSYGTDKSGAFGSGTVRFEKGVNVATAIQRKVRSNVAVSHLLVGGDEFSYVTVVDPDYTSGDVVRWGFLSVPETADPAALEAAGDAHIAARKRQTDTLVFPQHDHGTDPANGIYEPGVHYWVGDVVSHHTGTDIYDANEQASPIAAITWELKTGAEANGDYWVKPEIGSTFNWTTGSGFEGSVPGSQHRIALCRDGVGDISVIETFTRTTASGWGTSEIGPWPWIGTANGTNIVDGDEGIIAGGGNQELQADGTWAYPIEILIKLRSTNAVSNDLSVQLYQDGVAAALEWFLDANFVAMDILVDGGSISGSTDPGVNIIGGAASWLRLRATTTELSYAVWEDGDPEPSPQLVATGTNTFDAANIDRLFINGGDWALDSIEIIGLGGPTETCIHGGPAATSGDATVDCGKCAAPGNHEHDYVAAGGTTGQLLAKLSDADWDTQWVNTPASGIDVEEDGVNEGTGITTLNFTTGLDVSVAGSEATVSASGGGSGIAVEEDGVEEGTGIERLNFTTNLDVSVSGTEATISAAGGGGGGPFNPAATMFIYDDMYFNSTTDSFNGGIILSGGGTQAVVLTTDRSHPGVLEISTGTSGTGRRGLLPTNNQELLPGADELTFGCIAKVPTLSDGTDTFTINWGLSSTGTAVNGNEQILFRYTHSLNAGDFTGICRNGGSESSLDTNVAVDAGGWHRLVFVVNAAATSVEFFIDGVSVGTISSNIPTTSVRPLPVNILKSAGATARTVHVDAYWYILALSPER